MRKFEKAILVPSGDQLAAALKMIVMGESDRVVAIAVHHIQVTCKTTIRYERNPSPVRRASGMRITCRVVGELEEIVSVYVHGVNVRVAIAVRCKDDSRFEPLRCAVRRNY